MMKTMLKRIFVLSLLGVLLVLSLTSCVLDDVFTNKTVSLIDKITRGDSYTMEYKTVNDVYYKLQISGNQMYCAEQIDSNTLNEIYFYCNEKSGEYFYVTESTIGEANYIDKKSITKEEYTARFAQVYTQYSNLETLFHYRNILEMARCEAEGSKYLYSKERGEFPYYQRTEYSIEVVGRDLILKMEIRDEIWGTEDAGISNENEEKDIEVVKSTVETTKYTFIGKTKIVIPQDVLDR